MIQLCSGINEVPNMDFDRTTGLNHFNIGDYLLLIRPNLKIICAIHVKQCAGCHDCPRVY